MLYLHICVFLFVYLQVRHPGALFLTSSYHYLFINIAYVMSICNFNQCCICVFVCSCICTCVFASQAPRKIVFDVLLPLPFQKYNTYHVYLQVRPMLYLCICVFVFVYLQVRHPGTLFLRSSYYYLFKNIAHVMSVCNFDPCCICIIFEVLVSSPFRKYMVCMV